MITKTIISRQPNGAISLTGFDDQDVLNVIIAKHVIAQGNTLIEVVDGVIEKPEEDHRDCWDYDVNSKSIVVDQKKLEEKVSAEDAVKSKRQEILDKMKITEEELAEILKPR